MFANDFKVFKFKKWFIFTKDFSNKKFKSTVSTFKLITLIFKFFKFFNYLASFRRMFFNSRVNFLHYRKYSSSASNFRSKEFSFITYNFWVNMFKTSAILAYTINVHTTFMGKSTFSNKRLSYRKLEVSYFTDFPCCMGQHFNIFIRYTFIVQFYL